MSVNVIYAPKMLFVMMICMTLLFIFFLKRVKIHMYWFAQSCVKVFLMWTLLIVVVGHLNWTYSYPLQVNMTYLTKKFQLVLCSAIIISILGLSSTHFSHVPLYVAPLSLHYSDRLKVSSKNFASSLTVFPEASLSLFFRNGQTPFLTMFLLPY